MRTGRSEVWKVPSGGGTSVQVTTNGGNKAYESLDGKFLYYWKKIDSGLWKMPVSGGEESQVLPSLDSWRSFCVANEGIYFIPKRSADQKNSIQFLSFATGKVRTVVLMSAPPASGLSISPDGQFLLFSQIDDEGSDLMLVENFR
jgi:Tol biopolymer transport system component